MTFSPNSTRKPIGEAAVGSGCAEVITGAGRELPYSVENRAAELGLPAASRAAPAGMSTTTVPSVAGETSKVYEAPPPEKLAASPWEAAPERTMSLNSNPVTFSPNSTAKLIASASVVSGCVALIVGVGAVPS